MAHDWTLYACLFLALWSAVIGGVFSAFSEFIMSGLLKADPVGAIDAMQQINRDVLKTQFVVGLILIAPLSVAFAIYGCRTLDGAARIALVIAPIVYLPSVFFMTIFGNVPMNNALAKLQPGASDAEPYWRRYGRVWTRLNHFRAVGSILTALLYLTAAVSILMGGEL